ncbi:T9SS type A sorting domain-containing protein [Sanyastnella coralliicola]|uniref:T9SS type A sorting domain-containing protein n=1 Tax=Sanyastnella coralliicola TaxID=3069118 RepID=UPI0027BAC348|nr:T9SS type A sorting domain-containing protein [Longitalea sp. SCSIO 12813]
MRKALLLAGACAFALSINAQTVIYSDDFESYTAGSGIAEQADNWYVWNEGLDVDGEVSTDYAASGSNSVLLDQANDDDIVYDLGGYTSGKYDVEFKMLIPTGSEGYFNLMHSWEYTSTNAYEWAVDVYFSTGGDMTWTTGSFDGGALSFAHDEWNDVKVAVDLDNDMGYLYLNGELATSFQWSLNNADGSAGLNQLQVVNFFAFGPDQSNGLYYLDDFTVTETTGLSVNESDNPTVAIYPNPATDIAKIDITGMSNAQVRVIALDGRIAKSTSYSASTGIVDVNVSDLNDGIYFIEVNNGLTTLTQRLVVRH